MKTLFSLKGALAILILSILFIAAGSLTSNFVKSSERGYVSYYTAGTIIAGDTLIGNAIDLTVGIEDTITFGKALFTSSAGKPHIKVVHQEKIFGTWTDANTIYADDSLETVQALARTVFTSKLNRYLFIGLTGNATDTGIKWTQTFKKLPE